MTIGRSGATSPPQILSDTPMNQARESLHWGDLKRKATCNPASAAKLGAGGFF
jgi:hypothetical protein